MSALTGSITLANTRLSLVNGTAFIDDSAGAFQSYLNYRLVVTDSAGKKAIGYIKAVGTGETYGAELVANGAFDSDTSWDKGTGWTIEDGTGKATAAPYAAGLYQYPTGLYVGALYKMQSDIVITTGTIALRLSGENGSTITSSSTAKWYFVNTNAGGALNHFPVTTFTGTVDNTTLKQVLTPSATGVTITSTPNGSTYNWASIEAGFKYNDASGYSYTIYAVVRRKSKFISQYNHFYRRNR